MSKTPTIERLINMQEITDLDELEEDDFELDEIEDEPNTQLHTRFRVDEDEEKEEEEEAMNDLEETFRQTVGAPNEASKTPVLREISDDALVEELAELLLTGDDSEMTTILIPIFTGNRGGKIAKMMIRDARDRVISKIKRVASIASDNVASFKDEDNDPGPKTY